MTSTMSNKQVPTVYRTIINQVIESVRPDFDDVGVEEAVLQELLRSWESKVAVSRVADFSQDVRMGPLAKQFPMLANTINSASSSNGINVGNGASSSNSKTTTNKLKNDNTETPSTSTSTKESTPLNSSAATTPAAASTSTIEKKDEVLEVNDEINSDLDDPEEEDLDNNDDDGNESGDLVIALYEKVQRVKNKWKVTLKDGLISVGGKEYLFAKCSGEFEW